MSASGEADLSRRGWVPRVRRRTLAPDSPGSVRSHTQGGLQLTLAPDSPGSVRSHTQGGCKFSLTPDDDTRPTEGAFGALSEAVRLVINVSPDALCSASGATLRACSAPVFKRKQLADPWT